MFLHMYLDFLKRLGITLDSSQLPVSRYPDQSAALPLNVPIYGDLLVIERKLLDEVRNVVHESMGKFRKLAELTQVPLNNEKAIRQLHFQLQRGTVVTAAKTTSLPDWQDMGQQALIDSCRFAAINGLAKDDAEGMFVIQQSETFEISNLTAVLPIVAEHIDSWLELGHDNSDVLELANLCLTNQPITQTTYKVVPCDADAVLSACGLTYHDLEEMAMVAEPNFLPELLFAIRTGTTHYRFLEYRTVEEVKGVYDAMWIELGIVDPDHVIENRNVDKLAAGGSKEVASPLDQKESQTTSQSKSRKSKSKTVKTQET